MKIYKITEASEYLGVSINTLKTIANSGKINSFKTSGEDTFSDFILSIAPDERWKNFGYVDEAPYEFYLAVICRCLSFLSILQVRKDNVDIVPLDEKDFTILGRVEGVE